MGFRFKKVIRSRCPLFRQFEYRPTSVINCAALYFNIVILSLQLVWMTGMP